MDQEKDIRKIARQLVKDGFSIIPVQAKEKIPELKAWNKFYLTPTVETNLKTLERLDNEECNYGVRTGKQAGYIVLDADVYKRQTNEDIEDIVETLMDQTSMIVRTPSGGYHLYYSYDARFDEWTTTHMIYGYLDLQTSNAQVVGPGSTLLKDGKVVPYELLKYGQLQPMPETAYKFLEQGRTLLKHQRDIKQTEREKVESENTVNREDLTPLINIALTTNYQWTINAEEMGRFKLSHNTHSCLVTKHEHTDLNHSCIFVKKNRVHAQCFNHGVRQITGDVSRKLREMFFPELIQGTGKRVVKDVLTDLLTIAAENGLVRKDGDVYVRDRDIPWLYQRKTDIKSWISECLYEEELLLNMPQKQKDIIDFFTGTDRVEMPFLRPNKQYLGFRNGVLDLFSGKMLDKPEEVVPRHYIDQHFDMSVTRAPLFEKIVEYQLEPDIAFCLYAFIGRLFYDVKKMDNLGVIPFIKGDSETGKSTILNVIQALFAPESVGIINSNQETTFGLQSKYDKELILSHEVSEKAFNNISEDVFKQMACGELVNVPIKNQSAKTVKWTVPIFLCGNGNLGYKDTRGSISRRLAIFKFERLVEEKDSELESRILQEELASIVAKGLCHYHEMLNGIGSKSWDETRPKYFVDTIAEMKHETDLLYAFLTQNEGEAVWTKGSIHFQYVPGQTMLLSEFRKKFQNWVQFDRKTTHRWTGDHSVFKELGYTIERRQTCCACLKPSPGDGTRCCDNYNYKNRSQKHIIMNIVCHEKRFERGEYVSH